MLQADAYVLALGSWSPRLVRPLGISLPVYPVKGYSITVPISDPEAAPVSTVMDESYKVAITRLGIASASAAPPKFPAIRPSYMPPGALRSITR